MFNHMVYDVFIKNEDDYEDKETKLRGMSRFGDDVKAFTAKGLEFRHALYAFRLCVRNSSSSSSGDGRQISCTDL